MIFLSILSLTAERELHAASNPEKIESGNEENSQFEVTDNYFRLCAFANQGISMKINDILCILLSKRTRFEAH